MANGAAVGWVRAVVLLLAAIPAGPSLAREYFVSNASGSGSGTAADPFGMADLPDPTSEKLKSKAIEALQPGDTLTFRGGDYRIKTLEGKYYWLGYLRAARPGRPDKRITLRACPGEKVRLIHAGGGQPMLGGGQYVTYQGFTIETGPHAAARIGGTGVEVAYCHIKGMHLDTSDNHDGLRIEGATACHVHHCIIEGVTGRSLNSAGIKLYRTTKMVVEDNYIHSNTAGIFDKDSGIENTYRRNWLTGNRVQFYGNNQGKIARYFIHDNVVDGQISLHAGCNGCEVHDNLVRADTLTGAWAGGIWNNRVWNNIVLSGGKGILAFYEKRSVFVAGGDKPHLALMDFNLYDAAPRYEFGEYAGRHQKFTLADMRAKGFEKHAEVVAGASALFMDEKTWKLKPQWARAGKNGDAPGPDEIAEILNLTRYGPAALPKPASAQPRNHSKHGKPDGVDDGAPDAKDSVSSEPGQQAGTDPRNAVSIPGNLAFSVMGYNIRYQSMDAKRERDGKLHPWDGRKRMVAAAIAQKDPDILGLQEAEAGQRRYLAAKLRGYDALSTIFWKQAKFTKLGQGSRKLPGSGRSVEWVRLKPVGSERDLFAFNTHFPPAMREPQKVKVCTFVANLIHEMAGADSLVILTGDLNIHDNDSKGIQILRERAKLCDPWTDTGTSQRYTWNFWFKPTWSGNTVDWILYRRPLRALRVERPAYNEKGEYPSDHLPVFAALAGTADDLGAPRR